MYLLDRGGVLRSSLTAMVPQLMKQTFASSAAFSVASFAFLPTFLSSFFPLLLSFVNQKKSSLVCFVVVHVAFNMKNG